MSTQQRIAGRALDAEVAERVMGWVWRRSNHSGRRCLYPDGRWPEWMDKPADGAEPLVGDWPNCHVDPFSTGITAAFQIVDAMRGRGWHWRAVASCVVGEKYRVGFSVIGCVGDWDRIPEREAKADTLPLAISLAALAAIEAATPASRPENSPTELSAPFPIPQENKP